MIKSNSQINQEEWVCNMLKHQKCGFFVEVGAYDGVKYSNTYYLEQKLDWKGLLIEANPKLFDLIANNRHSDTSNVAITNEKNSEVKFLKLEQLGGVLNHLPDDVHKKTRDEAISNDCIIRVRSNTLQAELDCIDAPKVIDYISIDTEGSELEVLKSLNFDKYAVCLLTIEHAGDERRREEYFRILNKYGFKRKKVWFEDWYWNEEHLGDRLKLPFNELIQHIESVWYTERHTEKERLMRKALNLEKVSLKHIALDLYDKLSSDYYPNNSYPKRKYLSLKESFAKKEDKFFFLHIPKTAGTSFRASLLHEINESDVFPNNNDIKENGGFYPGPEQLEECRENGSFLLKKLFQGHYQLGIGETYFPNSNILCFFREPISRVISNLKHFQHYFDEYKGKTLEEIAGLKENKPQIQVLNLQSSYLGLGSVNSKLKLIDSFEFIGISEEYERSISVCNATFNWNLPLNININKAKNNDLSISDELIEFIKEHNKEDMHIYHKAVDIFHKRAEALGL